MASPIVRTASRTGTTADAPTVRPVMPRGCHGYVLSTDTVIGYLCTLVFLPVEAVYDGTQRNTIQLKRCSLDLFYHSLRKAEREQMTMDDNMDQHAERLALTPPTRASYRLPHMRSTLSHRLTNWLTQLESLSSPQAAGSLIPHEESSRALERRGPPNTSPHRTTTPRC